MEGIGTRCALPQKGDVIRITWQSEACLRGKPKIHVGDKCVVVSAWESAEPTRWYPNGCCFVRVSAKLNPLRSTNYHWVIEDNMTQSELLRLRAKLAVLNDIAKDFKHNTTIEVAIKEYEAKVKHHEQKLQPYEPTRGC